MKLYLQSLGLFFLVIEDALQLQYLVFELPQLQLTGVVAVPNAAGLAGKLVASLHDKVCTSVSYLLYFRNMLSIVSIFYRSMRQSFELRTTSSDITISWCSFSFILKQFSCTYFLPKLFIPRPVMAEKGSSRWSFVEWEDGLSERVFSERDIFLLSDIYLRLVLSASLIDIQSQQKHPI